MNSLFLRYLLYLGVALYLLSPLGYSAEIKTLPPALHQAIESVFPEDGNARLYEVAYFDLNADGVKEALVYVGGPLVCGSGGCSFFILQRIKNKEDLSYRVVGNTALVRLPIGVLPRRYHGWRSVAVHARDIGLVELRFDGKQYPDTADDIGRRVRSKKGLKILLTP